MSETYVISLQSSVDNLTTIVKELKRDLNKADVPYEAVEPLFIISGITQLKEIHTNWEARLEGSFRFFICFLLKLDNSPQKYFLAKF